MAKSQQGKTEGGEQEKVPPRASIGRSASLPLRSTSERTFTLGGRARVSVAGVSAGERRAARRGRRDGDRSAFAASARRARRLWVRGGWMGLDLHGVPSPP